MNEITKIVLTGGPCGGKTSALKFVSNELKKLNINVITIEERATKLFLQGKSPEKNGRYEFHKELFELEYEEEQQCYAKALKSNKKTVILLDRGLLDNKAYVTEEEFKKYASLKNMDEDKIRNSYDAVFHLVTAANGAEKYYNKSQNNVRKENIQLAKELDEKVLNLWVGTQHLRIIDNTTNFEQKLNRLLKEILSFIGVPKPLEIERKFLIKYPDVEKLKSMPCCKKIPIEQYYLLNKRDGNFRVRKRSCGSSDLYIKTIKRKISNIKRIEIENTINKEEYFDYINNADECFGKIKKDRYCIAYDSFYFELDVYPFWSDRATLEIELINENEHYKIPEFIKVIREVSDEPEYRNFALAKKFKNNP